MNGARLGWARFAGVVVAGLAVALGLGAGQAAAQSAIWTMKADGSEPVQVGPSGVVDGDADWSPDGTKIAFMRLSPIAQTVIYVMNADGSGVARLSPPGIWDMGPDWSPDGTKIAFVHRGELDSIFVMNADGSGRTPLTGVNRGTGDRSRDRSPAWSPDGTHIAYSRCPTRSPPRCDIWLMNADGSGQTDITNTPGADDSAPTWSPDGAHIAFKRTAFWSVSRYGVVSPASVDLWSMNADGSNQHNITNESAGYFTPTWSPNGDKIAYDRSVHPGGSPQIFLMNPDGSDRTNITHDPTSRYGGPDWSPDGTHIVFWSTRIGSFPPPSRPLPPHAASATNTGSPTSSAPISRATSAVFTDPIAILSSTLAPTRTH